jgi:AcrR family transcriptional regulator
VTTVRARPSGRREAILVVALDLFARHGYQSTGIDDIGAALDITGPAIYRHFGSKQELLAAAFAYSFEMRRDEIRAVMAGGATPHERLELIIRDTVRDTLEHRSVLTLYTSELRHLAPEDGRKVARKVREFTQVWVNALLELFPTVSRSEATMAVHCVHYLIATLADTDGGLGGDRLEQLLVDMSLAALYAVQPSGKGSS